MTERIAHPVARAGYAAGAEAYHRARPDYPGVALERLFLFPSHGPRSREAVHTGGHP